MRKFKSYIFTEEKALCTGCGACVHSCMHQAIEMTADEEGFLYPQIDTDKCVTCGICDMVCPVTGTDTGNTSDTQNSFVATTNNKDYYQESASIGICTMLSKLILSYGGIVYGVFLDEDNWTAYHIKVETEEELDRIRNSKYLQSSTKKTFVDVKNLLNKGRTVLYIGTPCQIGGLKSYLRKSYDRLFTIDIICHGVFSPMLMPLEIDYWERKYGGEVHNFRFRSKRVYKYRNGGMVNFDLMCGNESKHIERHASSSPTYRCYAYSGDGINYNMRPSCYHCNFRSSKRYGDITVGDPWYISNDKIKNVKLRSGNTIRSLYSVNTPKGIELVDKIKHELLEEELPITSSFCQPATKETNRIIPQLRDELYRRCRNEEYGKLVEELLNCDLDDSQVKFEKEYRRIKIRKSIKRILFWK